MGSNDIGELGIANKDLKNANEPIFLMNIENAISVCSGYMHNFIIASKNF
jgi:hypothetical protein